MSAEPAAAEQPDVPLTFAWWETRTFPRLLPVFIVLSLAANAVAFFIFQVNTAPTATIPRPAPHVYLLSPSAPENAAFMNWLAAEDPALAAGQAEAPAQGLATATYLPSFGTTRTAARYLPREISAMPFPSGRDAMEVIRSATAEAPAPQKSLVAMAETKLSLSGGLAGRAWTTRPVIQAKSATPLGDAQFLLGVTPRGEVQYVFLQRPSGDSASAQTADAVAARALAAASLAPVEGEMAWGFASIAWGPEIYGNTPPKTAGVAGSAK